ncbi:hypothetical protein FACS1894145_1020 [Bacteroidia bacterium]|nr:hypothetical protein FACS1894145_1020 [Bacteroidia bacterium]
MKSLGYILVFVFCSLPVFSQKNLSLSGTLIDKTNDNEPIEAASVELVSRKDSAYIAGGISDANGIFVLRNLAPNNYILKITYIGYLPILKNVTLTEDKPSTNLGRIEMATNDILLKEAIVEGKKPEIIVKNDTLEYDAGSYKVTENAVVEDLLKKLPGVEIDKDGKVTVAGKEVKKFLVDGKDFFSNDPQVASKNLPAEMVDKLQVIDRKSDMALLTGFDDGDEETVINLTIRPGMKQGTMGNVLAGLGSDVQSRSALSQSGIDLAKRNGKDPLTDNDLRYQAGGFVNHMKNDDRFTLILGTNNNNNMGASDLGAGQFGGMRMRRGAGGGITESKNLMFSMNKTFSSKLNLNSDVRFDNRESNSTNQVRKTTFLSPTATQGERTLTNTDYFSQNLSLNFNLEWKPDSFNTLIFRPNIMLNRSNSTEVEEDELSNLGLASGLDSLVFTSKSDGITKGNGFSVGGTLDYAHNFKSKRGRVFSINLRGNYNESNSDERSHWTKTNYLDKMFADEMRNQFALTEDHTNNFRTTVSFVEPVGHTNFIQALYRLSYYNTKSINSTYDFLPEGRPESAALNSSQSRSSLGNSLEHRIGLNFKSVRQKYNYTVGFNVDPTRSTNTTYEPTPEQIAQYTYALGNVDIENMDVLSDLLSNIQGIKSISTVRDTVWNFSPVFNYNYNFGQRSNLRINYEGQTNQPSNRQKADYVDQSRPTNWVKGNPDLKPGYSNQLRVRFRKYVPTAQLMYNLDVDGNYAINDITGVTEIVDVDRGIRQTTYKNVNGNWDASLRGMINTPLRNKKFTLSNFMRLGYTNQNSYVNSEKNTGVTTSIMDNLGFNYRSDLFDIGSNVSIMYNNLAYSLTKSNNQETNTYRAGLNTTWYLPYKWTLESDYSLTARNGFENGFNSSEHLWNAAITKQVFNKRVGTGSLKLQLYDILKDRNNIMASSITNGYQTTEMVTIPSYFICSFIYKFSVFPKSSTATESDVRGEGRWRDGGGRGPGGPGFGGGRPF